MRIAPTCAAILSVVVAAALPAAPVVTALRPIEPGRWELRSRDKTEPSTRLCVRAGADLLQPRHLGQSCTRYVAEDVPGRAAVSYTCPGTGHGRTVIRVEGRRLVQIESQGVASGYPFALTLEGRRVGDCGRVTQR